MIRCSSCANDDCTVPSFGDGWEGVYVSANGGASFTDSLLPGYPGDTSSAGQASPIFPVDTAVSDPILDWDTLGGSPCCIDAGTTRMESSRISRLVRRALPPITEPHRARAAFFLSRGLLTCATVVPLRHFVIHGSGTSTPRPAFTFFVASTSRSETGIFRARCWVNTQSVWPTIA